MSEKTNDFHGVALNDPKSPRAHVLNGLKLSLVVITAIGFGLAAYWR
jgi:hypothetical protein